MKYQNWLWWITLPVRLPFIGIIFIGACILIPNEVEDHKEMLRDMWRGEI